MAPTVPAQAALHLRWPLVDASGRRGCEHEHYAHELAHAHLLGIGVVSSETIGHWIDAWRDDARARHHECEAVAASRLALRHLGWPTGYLDHLGSVAFVHGWTRSWVVAEVARACRRARVRCAAATVAESLSEIEVRP